jgi:hypothetical protein
MKFGKVYSQVSGKQLELDSVVSPQKDPARLALIHNWLQSTVTQEMLADINENEQGLITLAIQQACSYPSHNNHQQIVQLLVRVDTLRKLKETYVNTDHN